MGGKGDAMVRHDAACAVADLCAVGCVGAMGMMMVIGGSVCCDRI